MPLNLEIRCINSETVDCVGSYISLFSAATIIGVLTARLTMFRADPIIPHSVPTASKADTLGNSNLHTSMPSITEDSWKGFHSIRNPRPGRKYNGKKYAKLEPMVCLSHSSTFYKDCGVDHGSPRMEHQSKRSAPAQNAEDCSRPQVIYVAISR